MARKTPSATLRCAQRVSEPPWYIRDHKCDRPVKHTLVREEDDGALVQVSVCGVHARPMRRRGWREAYP